MIFRFSLNLMLNANAAIRKRVRVYLKNLLFSHSDSVNSQPCVFSVVSLLKLYNFNL